MRMDLFVRTMSQIVNICHRDRALPFRVQGDAALFAHHRWVSRIDVFSAAPAFGEPTVHTFSTTHYIYIDDRLMTFESTVRVA